MKRIVKLFLFTFFTSIISAQIAPNFTILDTDNNSIKLYEDLLDQDKIVIIDLFFVICPLCKPYNAPFQALYEEFGSGTQDVEFLLLTTKDWDSNAQVADYRTQYGLTYPGSGTDGGGLAAAGPYINGDFGTFFGTPTYIAIAPNRKVYFNIGGGGTTATMDKIRSKILEIRAGIGADSHTQITINLESYKTNVEVPEHTFYLRSGDDVNNKYVVPTSFEYPSIQYPELSNPEIVVDIPQINNSNISTLDLFTIQRNLLGLETFDNFQKHASDVNGSNSITASDLLLMRKLILQLEDKFPVNKSYLSLDSSCKTEETKCVSSIKIDLNKANQTINFTVIKIGDVK